MVDLTQDVKVRWNNANKKHYTDLGYVFTKIKDEFLIKAIDLPKSSSVQICVKCDFCQENYYPSYKNYLHSKGKDCCKKCFYLKAQETMIERYGVEHYAKTLKSKEKFSQTCLERYGVENPSQVKLFQDKKKQTNREKFGEDWFVESNDFKEFCEENYGVSNPMQSLNIQQKASNTLCKNNNVPVSKQEKKMCKLLKTLYGDNNCHDSFPEGRLVMDCLLETKGQKIDVEYDGWYWHKSRLQSDRARDEILKTLGYKILRIRSNGKVPSKEQIIQAIDYLTQNDKTFAEIRIDI